MISNSYGMESAVSTSQNQSSGQSQGSSSSELDSEDEESSSDDLYYDVEDKVAKMERDFQKLWKRLNFVCEPSMKDLSKDNMNKAKKLYLKGILYERDKNINEALKHYRKAMQIVPDIDVKMTKSFDTTSRKTEDKRVKNHMNVVLKNIHEISEESTSLNVKQFTNFNRSKSWIICKLPREILLSIFQMFLNELDFKTIVCRYFYLLARDEQLWQKTYQKINFHLNVNKVFLNTLWKDIVIKLPFPRFDGWYISKSSYWRYGESDFCDDSSCLPCYSIKYYRYLKFFDVVLPNLHGKEDGDENGGGNGIVVVLNSVEPPGLMLPKLLTYNPQYDNVLNHNCNASIPSLLVGKYYFYYKTLQNNCNNNDTLATDLNCAVESIPNLVSIIVTKHTPVEEIANHNAPPGRRHHHLKSKKNKSKTSFNTSTYYMKFRITENTKGQPNRKLFWKHYSLFIKYSNGNKSKTIFDLSLDKYPPLTFVSNYHFLTNYHGKI